MRLQPVLILSSLFACVGGPGNRHFKHPSPFVCQPGIPAATAVGLSFFPRRRPTAPQISPLTLDLCTADPARRSRPPRAP